MSRHGHGTSLSLDEFERANTEITDLNARFRSPLSLVRPPDPSAFDYLLPDLQQEPGNLLPRTPSTVGFLTQLASSMQEYNGHPAPDSTIPSAYTYFGQFVDHDITLELGSTELTNLSDPKLAPLKLATIREKIRNGRTATLDLDSVYRFPAPREGPRMTVGTVSQARPDEGIRPAGKDERNDLPRKPPSEESSEDRVALIGDARNDVNLVIAQLHVAFLRAHNAIVAQGHSYARARTLLRQHYQWVVINDYLKRVADRTIVDRILANGNQVYDALAERFFLPLEFSAGAFRFGHSMIRPKYDYNVNFTGSAVATLQQLFTFTARSGNFVAALGEAPRASLPEHWIIEWERFLDGGSNKARRIDTHLVEPLFSLPNEAGGPAAGDPRLAVRNLLRGYLLRIPTGQAVAGALKITPLSPQEIREVAPTKRQHDAITAGRFDHATPLWFYVLAEAARAGGNRLGPLGSTLVAEVLIGLVRRSLDSILAIPEWRPSLQQHGDVFELPDLLRLGGVLS